MAAWSAQLRSTLRLGHLIPVFPSRRSALLINVDQYDRPHDHYQAPRGDVHLFRVAAALGSFAITICGETPAGIDPLTHETDVFLDRTVNVMDSRSRTRSWLFCNNQFSDQLISSAIDTIAQDATRRHLTFVYIHAPHMMTPYGFIAQGMLFKYENLFALLDTLPGRKVMAVCSPQGNVFLRIVSHLATAGAYAAIVPGSGILGWRYYDDFRDNLISALTKREWIGAMTFGKRFTPFNTRL